MSAAAATTLERQDVVAGARILAATLGDAAPKRAAPAPAAASQPVQYDADEDIYGDGGDDEESGGTANPLRNILASIGADGLQFDRLRTVPDRLDRLELALMTMGTAAPAANPWADVAPPPPEEAA